MDSRSQARLKNGKLQVVPIGGKCTWRRCKELAYFGHATCNLVDGEEVWAGGKFCPKHSEAFAEMMFPSSSE